MKKVIIPIIVLSLLAIGYVTLQGEKKGISYANEEMGFNLQLPEGWVTTPIHSAEGISLFTFESASAVDLKQEIKDKCFSPNVPPDTEFCQSTLLELEQTAPEVFLSVLGVGNDFSESLEETIDIGKHTFYTGLTIFGEHQYVITHEGKRFIFTSSSQDIIEEILSTLEFD